MASITSHPFTRTHQSTSPFVSSTPTSLSSNRLTTPLAPPPPPPLYMSAHEHISGPERQIRYAGADHTLGPTFSEEEDGDDSAYIAAKMAALGLDPSGRPYSGQNGFNQEPRLQSREIRTRTPLTQSQVQRQIQMQYLTQQAQQQQALLHLLSQQNQNQNQNQVNPQLREAMALIELQQIQQSATDRHLHSQQQQSQRIYNQNQSQRQSNWEREQNKLLQQQQQLQLQYHQQQQQQQQQQQIREMQYLQDLHLQQQLAALQANSGEYQNQQRTTSNSGNSRSALSAQMQANLQARTGRVAQARGMGNNLDDSELRARFEHASNDNYNPQPIEARSSQIENSSITSPLATGNSPTSPSSWRTTSTPSPTKTNILTPTELPTPTPTTVQTNSIRSPKGGRFSQARQAMALEGTENPYGTLTSTLSGKSLVSNPEYQTPTPIQSIFTERKAEKEERPQLSPTVEKKSLKYTLGSLGIGKPTNLPSNINRAVTLPVPESSILQQTQRTVSQPVPSQQLVKITVIRQPNGPPCEASELGDKNFQSRLRRKAGLNLTMLNRRTESPCPTPVLA